MDGRLDAASWRVSGLGKTGPLGLRDGRNGQMDQHGSQRLSFGIYLATREQQDIDTRMMV